MKNELSESRFFQALERDIAHDLLDSKARNDHSLDAYRSIQITARQLIRYEDPFISEFLKVKKFISNADCDAEIKKKISGLDLSSLTRDVEFFYPYEIQVVDESTNENNKEGDASHSDIKEYS